MRRSRRWRLDHGRSAGHFRALVCVCVCGGFGDVGIVRVQTASGWVLRSGHQIYALVSSGEAELNAMVKRIRVVLYRPWRQMWVQIVAEGCDSGPAPAELNIYAVSSCARRAGYKPMG